MANQAASLPCGKASCMPGTEMIVWPMMWRDSQAGGPFLIVLLVRFASAKCDDHDATNPSESG